MKTKPKTSKRPALVPAPKHMGRKVKILHCQMHDVVSGTNGSIETIFPHGFGVKVNASFRNIVKLTTEKCDATVYVDADQIQFIK